MPSDNRDTDYAAMRSRGHPRRAGRGDSTGRAAFARNAGRIWVVAGGTWRRPPLLDACAFRWL